MTTSRAGPRVQTGRLRVAMAAVLLAALVVGCGGAAMGQDKAGAGGGVVTLRVGTADAPGQPSGEDLAWFAADLDQVSGGAVKAEIVYDAQGVATTRWDQAVAQSVIQGSLDLGLVPARAWDALGVTSLQALQAPFLITSQSLEDKVVSGELATALLGGLRPTGVVGLSLWPESLRHPVGFGTALLAPRDFAGRGIRAPYSGATWALLTALGATAIDADGTDAEVAVRAGSITGAESGLDLVAHLPAPPTVTANVAFFPKVDVLVTGSAVLDRMTDAQRAALRSAASDTQQHVIATRPSEADLALAACRDGATVVLASQADQLALVAAAAPATAALEADGATKATIEAIRALSADTPEAPDPSPCRPPTQATPAPSAVVVPSAAPGASSESATIPDGVYRKVVTMQELEAAGVNATDAYGNAGTMDFQLRGGRFVQHTVSPANPTDCPGTYTVSGDTVTFTGDPTPDCGSANGAVLFVATWAYRDGQLQFSGFPATDPFGATVWGGKAWTKVG